MHPSAYDFTALGEHPEDVTELAAHVITSLAIEKLETDLKRSKNA